MTDGKIIGFKKFISKKGTPTCLVFAQVPFTEKEHNDGANGFKVEEIWVPADNQGQFTREAVGKTISVDYTIVNGRAYVSGVIVK